MIEKELDVVTWDNIHLDSAYIIKIDKNNSFGSREVVLQTAFGGVQTNHIYGNYSLGDLLNQTVSLERRVKTLGETLVVDILKKLDIKSAGFKVIEEKYPLVAKELKTKMPKNYLTEINKGAIRKREVFKKEVQKQYDELTQLFEKYGSKADKAMMLDIDDLLYCEAQGFMLKLEERINKKSNPKNLRLYKALQAIRGKDVITCK